jgi:membrane dipeptidase
MSRESDLTARWSISEDAAVLHADACICDMTLPWVPHAENKEIALRRFRAAGFDFLSLSVGVESLGIGGTLHHMANVKAKIQAEPEKYIFVHTVEDIREAKKEGKLALGFHFQGTEMLERNSKLVQLFYDLGIRHMILAYNHKNRAGDGCHERTDSGLSRYGVELVHEMNRVGMLLDLSHTGYVSSIEAMEICEAPVIFSHSNPYGVRPHARNIRDDQIRACAKTGGIIGMVGFGHFMKDNDISPESFVRNIDYVAELVGPEHVGIGLDFVYYPEQFYREVMDNPEWWPEEYLQNLDGFRYFPPEELPRVTEILIKQGYSESDIRGILGENFLRVANQVWK